jgi:two-component system chemotaxis response regulator CheY
MARILIVDDDPTTRELLRIQLTNEGHSVFQANEASEAIRMLLAEDFNLVLTDIQMPHLDGMELARAIIGDPKTRHVPVIVLTGDRSDGVFQRVRSLGAPLLTKPVQGEELLREVRKALGG